jgi:hypothetical protein
VKSLNNALSVLMGLNRRYHWGEFKRIDKELPELEIAPTDLARRVHLILTEKPKAAMIELERLIEEIFELVREQMPDYDAGPSYARFKMPLAR